MYSPQRPIYNTSNDVVKFDDNIRVQQFVAIECRLKGTTRTENSSVPSSVQKNIEQDLSAVIRVIIIIVNSMMRVSI